MAIELPKEAREQAIASLQRYFAENMEEKIGKERLQIRVAEVDMDVHQDEFTYWRRYEKAAKAKK